MKKLIVLFSMCLLLFGMIGVAGATTITYSHGTSGDQFISPYAGYAGVTTENFEGGLHWTWADNFQVVPGVDISGVASAPAGVGGVKDASKYVSVPINVNNSPQSATVTVGGSNNYFGLWWGSVDTYNTLTFLSGGIPIPGASFTGLDITTPNAANGNQTASSTNLYVNFLGLPSFDGFMMTSTQYAFEADNIAVGNVPEPATMLLLGSGLVGLAGYARRRFRK